MALSALSCRDVEAGRVAHAEPQPPSATPAASVAPAREKRATVELVARNESGVPLHPQAGASQVSGRVPGGTRAVVEAESADGRWLRIIAPDGATGWITRRYARGDGAPQASRPAPAHASPWSSPADCQALLDAAERAPRPPGAARIATWNLRWFPDGRPGYGASGDLGTDLAWLACAIVWLDVDVVAVQEIKAHARARERTRELLAMLDARGAGRWQARIDECPNQAGQHVGLLWNEKRVTAGAWMTLASLNPHAEPCKDQLRPGLGARFRFGSGLDVVIVSLHLKSGRERRSYELRRRSLAGLSTALRELDAAAGGERDVLLAGDLNTMGCPDCSPPISSADELATLDAEVRGVGLRVVRATPACSEYFGGRAALLDHFVAETRMAELPAGTTSFVSGLCSETSCRAFSERSAPPAHVALSDHCPVVIDLDGRDLD